MSIRPIDISKRLNISKQAVNECLRKGMPTETLAEAEAWYYSRLARRADNTVEVADKPQDSEKDEFSKRVDRQMGTVDDAWQEWDSARRNGEDSQNKLYATYDKAVKMLITLQREEQSRKLASKELVRSSTAIAIFSKVLSGLRTELTQLGGKISAAANPDHPGMAMKAVDDEVNRILRRISAQEEEAVSQVAEPTPIEVTPEEGPDEVSNDDPVEA
jgi:hypothetical protein